MKKLLLLKYILFNLVAASLLMVAWSEGLVGKVIAADQTYLSLIIFIVFLIGWFICTRKAIKINNEIDLISEEKSGFENHEGAGSGLRLQLFHRIAVVKHLGGVLVLLGLIGTVLGFIIALSGVDPNAASDIEHIAPMVTALISGMSTALYTTLVGSILNVWLMANYQMLLSATVKLISLVEDNEL